MYPKYQTEAIILMSYPLKEADKAFIVWTKDFGKLHLRAAGIRKEQSKLRQNISIYLKARLTILQGKSGWRLLEVSEPEFSISDFSEYDLQQIFTTFKILLKLSPGMESSGDIFKILSLLLGEFKKHDLDNITAAANFSILAELGYTDKNMRFFDLNKNRFLEERFLNQAQEVKRQISRAFQDMHINL